MKISHESPLCLLEKSREYNDYDYALVHVFEENQMYYDFFKESLERGRTVILDNSIFELGTAFEFPKYLQWIQKLKPTEYIIPDVLEDAEGTMQNALKWKNEYSNLVPAGCKSIGVVQGDSYEDLVRCYEYLDKEINVDKIAISFDYSYYLEVCPHPNKWMGYVNGRVNTLSRMLNDGVINTSKPHHLLGCALPVEFFFYREGFDWIESLDTSSPIVHGLLDTVYEPAGIVNKQSVKLVDLLSAEPTPDQDLAIRHNVNIFRTYVEGIGNFTQQNNDVDTIL